MHGHQLSEHHTSAVRSSFAPSFMSKVLTCFGLAVAVSALGAYLGLNYFASYFALSPVLTYGLIIVELILILTSGLWSKKEPINYVLFAAFAFITGLTLVPILAYLTLSAGGVDLLIKALTATALMFGACAIFGATTHYNLQGLRGFLVMSLLGMIIVSLVGLFLPWGNTFEMIFAGFGVVVFSGFVMYDMQNIKHYPEDMYIQAAMQLYLDIFNLFLYILRLISAFSRN
jgi:FtsH-binding integral membrane protein